MTKSHVDYPSIHYSLVGTVIHGEGVGHTLGFPTANLDVIPGSDELNPGVYFGRSRVLTKNENVKKHLSELSHQSQYDCLAYFGPRYILGEQTNNFEVYLYDFNQDIYGQQLFVELSAFLRAPQSVDNPQALQELLAYDVEVGNSLRK